MFVNGFYVLGSFVFSGCDGIENVILQNPAVLNWDYEKGDVVLEDFFIQEYTFSRCHNLKNVVFEGDTIDGIGRYAFDETSITDIDLPQYIRAISECAFPTTLKTLNLNGDEVPTVGGNGLKFFFKAGNSNDLHILLNGKEASDEENRLLASRILKKWKYNLIGYDSYKEIVLESYFETYFNQNEEKIASLRDKYGSVIDSYDGMSLEDEIYMLCVAYADDMVRQSEQTIKKMLGLGEDWEPIPDEELGDDEDNPADDEEDDPFNPFPSYDPTPDDGGGDNPFPSYEPTPDEGGGDDPFPSYEPTPDDGGGDSPFPSYEPTPDYDDWDNFFDENGNPIFPDLSPDPEE